MVSARPDILPPPAVLQIPSDGPAQTAVESLARRPAKFAPDLGDVHRVAPVMTRPVCNECDKLSVRPMCRARQHFVEQPADPGYDIEVGPLGVAANIVALAYPALVEDREQGARVVLDIKPIADIVALAVDRDRLAMQPPQDGERDQLFGEMVGSVIIRAVADDGRQPEGFVPGADQMIRSRL